MMTSFTNSGSVDPLRDIEIINSELVLADIATLEKRRHSREKKAKGGDKEAKAEVELIDKLMPHLDQGNPAITAELERQRGEIDEGFLPAQLEAHDFRLQCL